MERLGFALSQEPGETEGRRIELRPGKHALQLVLGAASHCPLNRPVVSEEITVRIKRGVGSGDIPSSN
ncbi:DUF4399 domain-containing protein [Bradyrhizobium sp.]|uniref:DUF4399 domain-containing protein n=1 Tax=Bradyrhizobium sp. TaxID=376 RepID=UPI0025B8F11D|nr:DUF4399 domain-containing protein [Bradyrhizobium sp.]